MQLCIVLLYTVYYEYNFPIGLWAGILVCLRCTKESRHPYFFRSTYVPGARGGIGVCMSPTYEILTTELPLAILSRSSVKSEYVDGLIMPTC